MSYDKEDFVLMTDQTGADVVVNISKIKFVTQGTGGFSYLFFGGGDDDCITVKTTIDNFMEIL